MEGKIAWLIIHDMRLSACEEHMRNCQMSTIAKRTFTYHLEKIIAAPWCIHRNDLLLQIELSGWKGYVRCALGADVSLTYCLATNIWILAPKAISGSKNRGTSFDTTVWPHVQELRSFSSFYANSMIWALFCSLEQKTKTTTTTTKQTKQTKQKKQKMRKRNLLKCYTRGVKDRKPNKTKPKKKEKTVAGSNQYTVTEKHSFSGKQMPFFKSCSQPN